MMPLVLLPSGREDERLTSEFETNMSSAVDSVRLWSGSQVGRVVVDRETEGPFPVVRVKAAVRPSSVSRTMRCKLLRPACG